MQSVVPSLGKSLVFLVGAPRSGTTWLQLCLASSPHIATANETHLFSTYTQSLFRGWESFQNNSRSIGIHHLLREDEFLEMVGRVSDAVLEKISQKKPSATVILEKTPAHARCWQDILAIYPQAKFLHLVRDPRAVVASLGAAAASWGGSWASTSVIENSWSWRRDIESARAISDSGAAYLEVRYEDLLAAPAEGLASILTWIGLPDENVELCGRYVTRVNENANRQTAEDQPWDLSKEPVGFTRRRGRDGWRSDLSPWQIRVVEQITGPLAEPLGYLAARPSPRPLRLRLFDHVMRFDRFWQWQKKKMLRYF